MGVCGWADHLSLWGGGWARTTGWSQWRVSLSLSPLLLCECPSLDLYSSAFTMSSSVSPPPPPAAPFDEDETSTATYLAASNPIVGTVIPIPLSPIRSPVKRGANPALSGALSPTSEHAFEKVLQKVARKVWTDEKDSALLQELESVLDKKTYNDIVEPLWPKLKKDFHVPPPPPPSSGIVDSDVLLAEEPATILPVYSEPEEEEEEDGDVEPVPRALVRSEPGMVLEESSLMDMAAETATVCWGRSFDDELGSGRAAVSVDGSRAQMLVRLQDEMEEEEEETLATQQLNTSITHEHASWDSAEAGDAEEDEWDDDLDPGFISVRISEEDMLTMETANIEEWRRASLERRVSRADSDIRPSSVWKYAREDGNVFTRFRHEMSDAEGSDGEASSSAGDGGSPLLPAQSNAPGKPGSPTTDLSALPAVDTINPDEELLHGTLGDIHSPHDPFGKGDFEDDEGGAHSQSEGSAIPSIDDLHSEGDADAVAPIYDSFTLRIVHERHRTGFEADKDLLLTENMLIAGRYRVKSMLGEAAFSTAWKCMDELKHRWVCLKIIKNSKEFLDQSLDEIKLLRYVNAAGDVDQHHVLRLYDYFYHKEHLFIATELLRDNLYEFSRFNRNSGDDLYFTIGRLRLIAKQMLEALRFLHSLGLIHCDLKPENVLIKSYKRCDIKIIDFGSSCYLTDHLSSYIQSRSYRAPEVLLGCAYDQKIDIWSVGCILAELWTGQVLFHNHSVASLLARIVGIIGPFPPDMLATGRSVSKYFTASNSLYESTMDLHESETGSGAELEGARGMVEEGKGRDDEVGYIMLYPKKTSLKHRLRANVPEFLDFMEGLLQIDPKKRLSTRQALRHPFLNTGRS